MPPRFRSPCEVKIDPNLVDPQQWDAYWETKKDRVSVVYEAIATGYRTQVIERRLRAVVTKNFAPGAKLLHAGCGSGQVDAGIQGRMRITGLDISPAALDLYARNNPDAEQVVHGNIFALPFADDSFDGVYNLGVVEHFTGRTDRVDF